MCQLQNQMSNEKAEIHDCMQAGVGWEEKGFTVRSLRSKTKILRKKKVTWRFPCIIQQTSVKVFQNSCADFAQGKLNCSVPPNIKMLFNLAGLREAKICASVYDSTFPLKQLLYADQEPSAREQII